MPAYVHHFTTDGGFGQATPITVAYSGVTKGNALLVMCFEVNTGVTFTTCTDGTNTFTNKLNFSPGSAAGTEAQWLCPSVATTSGTISVAYTGGPGGRMVLLAFEVSTVTNYDNGGADANFNTGPADAGGPWSLTHTNDIVFVAIFGSDSSTFSNPVGYTLIEKVDSPGSSFWYQTYWKQVSGGGAQNPTSTISGGSATWAMAGAGLYGPLPFGGCAYEC